MGNNRRREPAPTAVTAAFRARAVAAMVSPYTPGPEPRDHRDHNRRDLGDRHRRRGLPDISAVTSVATRFI